MKTVVDPIKAHPPHAFSPVEFRVFLRLLPSELLRDVDMVRLSAAIEHSAVITIASFSRLERRLVIVSRGVSRDIAMLEVMRCLIGSNMSRPANYGRGPVELSKSSVEEVVQDLFARVLPLMPAAPQWSRLHLKYLPVRKEANQSAQRTGPSARR